MEHISVLATGRNHPPRRGIQLIGVNLRLE